MTIREDAGAVARNEAAERFELNTEHGLATLDYEVVDDALVLIHTSVPEAAGGKGIGGRLVRAAVEAARADGLLVIPRCRFARAWLRRHPEYGDVLP